MSIIRLTPHLYLMTPLGKAEAHFVRDDDTLETPAIFGCFQCETKESWWWSQQHVRLCESISGARAGSHSPIMLSSDMLESLRPHILRHKESPFHGAID